MLRKRVIEDMQTHTEWSPVEAIRFMQTELKLTILELAKLSGLPGDIIEGIVKGTSPGTVEELGKLLGIVGLKLGVVRRTSPHRQCASDDYSPP